MSSNKKTDKNMPVRENLTLGILAHVDAGKTTLSEALLHLTGTIRHAGRVDHGDAFLDTDAMEKERGITIFSKQAVFVSGGRRYFLLDTPGHADFSTEMERVLQVLDAAVLVISAADGVNGQVRILWRLLQHYQVPAFIFVNKMDQAGADHDALLRQIREELSVHAVDFGIPIDDAGQQEELAVCDDALMEAFLDGKKVTEEDVRGLAAQRKVFPVLFGSALHEEGVQELLDVLDTYASAGAEAGDAFAARVYKISRDEGGKRLTWMKILGGALYPRAVIPESTDEKGQPQKVDQIRIYSGSGFRPVQEARPGMVVAVTGLTGTHIGQNLGALKGEEPQQILQPVIRCSLILPPGEDVHNAYRKLKVLEEEEPMLRLSYDGEKREITVQLMGQVQREILQRMIRERLSMQVQFGQPQVVYRETIANTVEGVGHFEPLRHYAEVHLLLEPSERGSGLTFDTKCSTNVLARNWQRLILTHLEERQHRGVLTGSPITDMKITLIGGRAHEKHTEGGDFRQATYRAVRQGLMMAQSVLLEPFYDFRLEVPSGSLGRAMNDLQQMGAQFGQPDLGTAGHSILEGYVAVSSLGEYAADMAAYTKGEGHITCTFRGYEPCHNAEEVIEKTGYFPELDERNPSSSVFCSHGVGTIIPWDRVRDYMSVDTGWRPDAETADSKETEGKPRRDKRERDFKERQRNFYADEDELRRIFERTYGPIRPSVGEGSSEARRSCVISAPSGSSGRSRKKNAGQEKTYLLVDGYNIIFAWEDLRELAEEDIKAARDRLMDILSNFAGYRSEHLILVFDAYRVKGNPGEVYHYHNIDVIYTKEAETADLYIEKAAHELTKKYRVTVATSDAVEQVIIYGAGAVRLSAKGLLEEIILAQEDMREHYMERQSGARPLGSSLTREQADELRRQLKKEED